MDPASALAYTNSCPPSCYYQRQCQTFIHLYQMSSHFRHTDTGHIPTQVRWLFTFPPRALIGLSLQER